MSETYLYLLVVIFMSLIQQISKIRSVKILLTWSDEMWPPILSVVTQWKTPVVLEQSLSKKKP